MLSINKASQMFPKCLYMRAKRIKGVRSYLRHFSMRMCSVCPAHVDDIGNDMAVLLETTLGDIVIDLYTEERPKGN